LLSPPRNRRVQLAFSSCTREFTVHRASPSGIVSSLPSLLRLRPWKLCKISAPRPPRTLTKSTFPCGALPLTFRVFFFFFFSPLVYKQVACFSESFHGEDRYATFLQPRDPPTLPPAPSFENPYRLSPFGQALCAGVRYGTLSSPASYVPVLQSNFSEGSPNYVLWCPAFSSHTFLSPLSFEHPVLTCRPPGFIRPFFRPSLKRPSRADY